MDLSAEWQVVKELASAGEPAAWAMAVIEAEKVFRETLGLVSFGDSLREKIKNATKIFHNLEDLLKARELHRRLVSEVGFLPTSEETTNALEAYFQAILDLTSFDRSLLTSWQVFQNKLFLRFGRLGRYLRASLIAVVFFFGLVWFLAETSWGKQLTQFVVELTRWVIGYLGFIIIGILILVLIVFLSFLYLDKGLKE